MPPAQDPTQSLLRWGIENAAPNSLLPLHEEIQAGRRPDLNTDILKQIMGTTDADRMQECVQVIQGKFVDREGNGKKGGEVTKSDQIRAWDDLEMLIEDLDNANNLKFLGLWKPIVSHLSNQDDEIVMRACWVCGTAVQNNPQAQESFLELDPLPRLSSLITSTTHADSTRNKAMYCLSSTLKHSETAVARFSELQGWTHLTTALKDPSLILRTKTAFLLSQLISQSDSAPNLIDSLRKSETLSTIISSLLPNSALPTGPDGDSHAIDGDYREKVVRFLIVASQQQGVEFEAEEKKQIREIIQNLQADPDWSVDDLGVAQSEWNAFTQSVE